MKNVLLVGANSDIAKSLITILLDRGFNVYAACRKEFFSENSKLVYVVLDICDENSIERFLDKIKDIKFDAVVNFAGVAITSPVECMNINDLKYQFDVSVFGLVRLLKLISRYLDKNSKVINLSSMASFGVFPFISPYCAAKAAGDILLNAFEIETGIKCVSIKPGVVRTKFWQYCIDINKDNFNNFEGKYKEIGNFLLNNAKANSKKGLFPNDVARVIFKAICAKRPSSSYIVGKDAKFASLSRFIPKNILNKIIRYTLNKRMKARKN